MSDWMWVLLIFLSPVLAYLIARMATLGYLRGRQSFRRHCQDNQDCCDDNKRDP